MSAANSTVKHVDKCPGLRARTRTYINTQSTRTHEELGNVDYVSTLRVFENRVLRRVFGPKGDEVTGEWRKLHNEELNDLDRACGAHGGG